MHKLKKKKETKIHVKKIKTNIFVLKYQIIIKYYGKVNFESPYIHINTHKEMLYILYYWFKMSEVDAGDITIEFKSCQ